MTFILYTFIITIISSLLFLLAIFAKNEIWYHTIHLICFIFIISVSKFMLNYTKNLNQELLLIPYFIILFAPLFYIREKHRNKK